MTAAVTTLMTGVNRVHWWTTMPVVKTGLMTPTACTDTVLTS